MKQNELEDEYKNNIRDKNGLINYKKLNRLISFKKRDLSDDLIRKHLQVHNLCTLLKKMFALRNKKENNNVTIVIKANQRIQKKKFKRCLEMKLKVNNQMKY